MISEARSVDEYLDELTAERREALTHLRGMIAGVAPDARELMKYGHPHWELGGSLFALASQKRHMSLYVSEKAVLAEYRDTLNAATGVEAAVGCVRFRQLDRLPLAAVREMLEMAVKRRAGRSPDG